MYHTKKTLTQLGYNVISAAIEVHKHLGPGILESVYEECLVEELSIRGIKVKRQVQVPISYKGMALSTPLRLDLLVEDILIVELKAVEKVLPVHEAQLLSYLKLAEKPKGILINFKTTNIARSALHRVTHLFTALP
ncbi:GxxExxY protein [Neolewinella persica]|uniref:GxxExxY protein n=1 Tax=Neolewinella persica TaxID=70998 RepID=UPI00037BCAE4|nr:GxxExxY protein [Neolewinella persica]